MSGKLDASDHRHDLGSHNEQKIKGQENITQIMWPSLYFQKVVYGVRQKFDTLN